MAVRLTPLLAVVAAAAAHALHHCATTLSRHAVKPFYPAMLAETLGDDERRNLKNEVRLAKAEASNAANAEARLRNMVAQAKVACSGEVDKRLNAEERADELQAELTALRELYTLDVGSLEAEVEDLTAQLEVGGGNGAASGTDPDARVAELSRERDELFDRAMRAEAALSDTTAECEALRELAASDAASHDAQLVEMAKELRAARAASAAAGRGSDDEARQTIHGLEGQIASLLEALDSARKAQGELMSLRLRMAEMEAKLAAMSSTTEPSAASGGDAPPDDA